MKKSTFRLFILSNMLLSSIVFSQVGINTATPQATLDIHSTGNTAATKSMRINNSNDTETVTVTDQGRVGIGETVPAGQLHVSTTGANGIISERSSTGSTNPSYINLRKNKSNDPNVNGAVTANDILGSLSFSGNTGTGYEGDPYGSKTSILSKASENFTETNQGSSLEFRTVPVGTATNEPRMTITDQGNIGIGTTTPEAKLDIHSAGSTSATKAMRIVNSNDNEMVTVTNQGRVGVGITTPAGQLHVSATGQNGIISERATIGVSNPPYISLRKNRSTSPNVNGAVQSNDVLGVITFAGNTGNGYEGDGLSSNSSIQAYAAENFTSTTQGSYLTFSTVPVGSNVSSTRITISDAGLVGLGRTPTTNRLEVNGTASKTSAGAFIANSDARLKKEIKPISGDEALNKLTKLEGVTYYWNDDKTGMERPKEKQIGFIAQNIQKVFPEKVTTDKQGYLQTAYGDYDAIFVEAIKELNNKILKLTARLEKVEQENTSLKSMRK